MVSVGQECGRGRAGRVRFGVTCEIGGSQDVGRSHGPLRARRDCRVCPQSGSRVAGRSVLPPVLPPFAAQGVAATALGPENSLAGRELEGAWGSGTPRIRALPQLCTRSPAVPACERSEVGAETVLRNSGGRPTQSATGSAARVSQQPSGESKSDPGSPAPSPGRTLLSRTRRKGSPAPRLEPEGPGPGASLEVTSESVSERLQPSSSSVEWGQWFRLHRC